MKSYRIVFCDGRTPQWFETRVAAIVAAGLLFDPCAIDDEVDGRALVWAPTQTETGKRALAFIEAPQGWAS